VSGGKFHAKIAGFALWPLLALAIFAGFADPQVGFGLAIGATSGLLVTPDVDLVTKTYEEWRIYNYREWLGIVWQAFWFPYALVMGHRGVSHWHGVGTLTRMGYFLATVYILANYVAIGAHNDFCSSWGGCGMWHPTNVKLVGQAMWTTAPFWIAWYIAWAIQDELHIVTDWGYSTKKRLRKAGKRPLSQFRRIIIAGAVIYAIWFFTTAGGR